MCFSLFYIGIHTICVPIYSRYDMNKLAYKKKNQSPKDDTIH